jgi:hypothetical protein
MIAQILWFAAGFITSRMYSDEITAWLEEVEDKIVDAFGQEVDFGPLNRHVRDLPFYEAAKKKRESAEREEWINGLIRESMDRVGLDSKDAYMNKTIGQISRAVTEAYDKYGEPGTTAFMKKWNSYVKSQDEAQPMDKSEGRG